MISQSVFLSHHVCFGEVDWASVPDTPGAYVIYDEGEVISAADPGVWQTSSSTSMTRLRSITMKVFLDDERPTPEGWVAVQWPGEAIALLQTGEVTHLSLDHDLGDDRRGTGYDVILWIEEEVAERGFVPPLIHVHSANASARQKMNLGIEKIRRLADSQKS